jgi:hypothetical protein
MTDFRSLCQELMDAIDSGIPVERIKQSPLAVRIKVALAQPEPQGPTDEELDLVVIAIQALTPHQPDVTAHDLYAFDRGREILKECLACWGYPTSDELEQFNA